MAKTIEQTKAPEASQGADGEDTTPDEQTTHYQDLVPNAETGVIEQETYHFPQYTVGGRDARLEVDIQHLFAKGFNPTPYDFAWQLLSRYQESAKRFYTPCRPDIHKKWFIDSAWDKNNKAITAGIDLRTSKKELILCVRPKAAKVAEDRAMLAISQGKNDPEKGDNVTEATDALRARADGKYVKFIGNSLNKGVERWG